MGITIPRTDVTPDDVWEAMLKCDYEDELERVVVVSEAHAVGHPGCADRHIHAYLAFSGRGARMTIKRILKPFGKHGNIQRLRSQRAWVEYIEKHQDDVPIGFDGIRRCRSKGVWIPFDTAKWLLSLGDKAKGRNKESQLAVYEQFVDSNPKASFLECLKCFGPGAKMNYLKKARDYYELVHQALLSDHPRTWIPLNPMGNQRSVGYLYEFMNLFVAEVQADREFVPEHKRNCIAVTGDPDMHKSSLAKHVNEHGVLFPTYQTNKEFPQNWSNGIVPYGVCIEQFDGSSLSYAQFESLVDCEPSSIINAKGGSKIVSRRLLFVFCSNTKVSDWWTIPVATGDGRPEGTVRKDLLSPAHRASLNSRMLFDIHLKTPLIGFPNPYGASTERQKTLYSKFASLAKAAKAADKLADATAVLSTRIAENRAAVVITEAALLDAMNIDIENV